MEKEFNEQDDQVVQSLAEAKFEVWKEKFIKRDLEIIQLYARGQISWGGLVERRLKLAGDKLVKGG